jgi:hypothetical protein
VHEVGVLGRCVDTVVDSSAWSASTRCLARAKVRGEIVSKRFVIDHARYCLVVPRMILV